MTTNFLRLEYVIYQTKYAAKLVGVGCRGGQDQQQQQASITLLE
jgi:hypothetical protein